MDNSTQPCPPSSDNLSVKEETTFTAKKVGGYFKNMFTAKRLALMAIFAALSLAVSYLEFAIFPSTPAAFLKLDFGNVFIMLIGFLLGPVEGVIVCVIKECLRIFTSSSGGVGELANILMTTSFILVPSIAYKFHKGLKVVIPCMLIGCLLATGMALIANRFILIPAYGIADAQGYFAKVWGYIIAFNLIKTFAISFLTLLLYKRLSNTLKKLKF
jgi:riboflavin transporter FmnP